MATDGSFVNESYVENVSGKEMSPMGAKFNEIDKELSILCEIIEELNIRLKPVINIKEESAKSSSANPTPVQCLFMEKLCSINYRIKHSTDSINKIMKELCL